MTLVLALLASAAGFCAALPLAHAEDLAAVDALKNELEHKVPSTWQIRVRWREGALLASFMPPYQEAFDLWYRPENLQQKMRDLCPDLAASIWGMLKEGEDIVLEPTVGGKTTAEMRVSCRSRR